MKKLKLSQITTDGGTQSRDMVNPTYAEELAEALGVGAELPAIVVFHDGDKYWLADGFHRVEAHKIAGKANITADIKQGTQRDAILFSVGANANHGMRRTNADRERAVTRLLTDEEWGKWSDREIARRCNVSQPYVSRLRARLTDNVISERTYRTKHGTIATMQTANINSSAPNPAWGQPKLEVGDRVLVSDRDEGTVVSIENDYEALIEFGNGTKACIPKKLLRPWASQQVLPEELEEQADEFAAAYGPGVEPETAAALMGAGVIPCKPSITPEEFNQEMWGDAGPPQFERVTSNGVRAGDRVRLIAAKGVEKKLVGREVEVLRVINDAVVSVQLDGGTGAFSLSEIEKVEPPQPITVEKDLTQSVGKAVQNFRDNTEAAKLPRVANDYYPTDEAITRALVERLYFDPVSVILEPCAGHGHIINFFDENGWETIANEPNPTVKFTPDYQMDATDPAFWAKVEANEGRFDWVVTNPPYESGVILPILQLSLQHARRGLAALLRLNYLEPCKDRAEWLTQNADHMRLWLPVSPRPKFRQDTNASDNITVAWCVWDKRWSWEDQQIDCPFQFLSDWR